MRVPKIYLETTMFNYYFDTARDAHIDTVKLFEEIKIGKYIAFTSSYAIREIDKTQGQKRDNMLDLLIKYDITVLEPSREAEQLAEIYLNEGVVPPNKREDALHIAITSTNDLDMILSLNFKHIVRKRTIEAVEFVNNRQGYHRIQIFSPMEVVDHENN